MQRGKKVISPHFMLHVVIEDHILKNQPPRIGVIVSQKFSKKANARNLLRRRITEILRRFVLPKSTRSFEAVLRVLSQKNELDFAEVRSELSQLFHKIKII